MEEIKKEESLPTEAFQEAMINTLSEDFVKVLEPITFKNKAKLLMLVIEKLELVPAITQLLYSRHSEGWAFTSNEREYKNIINKLIKNGKESEDLNTDDVSDGWHTFGELYEFRKMYNAVLFNEWSGSNITEAVVPYPKYQVHKSWKHNDGELAFGGGWFIVSAMLPTVLISNHYKAEDWDLFKVPEVEKALFEFDGHTGEDVLTRLKAL